jgi:ribonuclease HI
VWERIQALVKLSTQNHVELCWVPGLRGIEGNEVADKLAKKGANTPFIGPEPVCGISKSTAKTAFYQWARKEHKKDG